jgi:AMMECR1 domain-containing protein
MTVTSLSRLMRPGLRWQLNLALVLALATLIPAALSAPPKPKTESLPEIARQTLAFHFAKHDDKRQSLADFAHSFYVSPEYRKPKGLFVTLSNKGQTRACWGSLEPHYENLVEATVYTTTQALKHEYRYKPISKNEWQHLLPQITIVNNLEPISGGASGLSSQNPLRDGLFVRSGGKTGVLLPGEVRDAYYQLVKCKLKAGIKPKEQCQVFRVKADVIR